MIKAESNRDRTRRIYHERKAAGLCVRYNCARPPTHGVHCEQHHAYMAAAQRKFKGSLSV